MVKLNNQTFRRWLLGVFILCVGPGTLNHAAAENEVRSKAIDLRKVSEGIEYRMVVFARKSGQTLAFPGHTYILVGEYDHEAGVCRFDNQNIYGLYPRSTAEG